MKEQKTFPRRMLVWDDHEDEAEKQLVLHTSGRQALAVLPEYETVCLAQVSRMDLKVKWWPNYKEIPEDRPMTRNEILGFLAHTWGVVVRHQGGLWHPAGCWSYESHLDQYEYAYIGRDGKIIGEPHKFVTRGET